VDSAGTDAAREGLEQAHRSPVREPCGCAGASHEHAPPRTPFERVAGGVGNRGMSQLVARMPEGGGILAGGLVHPDVEMAIAQAQGGGRALDRSVRRQLEPALGASLAGVRVHTGDGAAALARSVSARAFTVGSDIFFGPGEYQPGTPEGDGLIAHEVAHTVQQRGAPATGPLTVSSPGDALEAEAEAAARGTAG
jgi:hypothetical protein